MKLLQYVSILLCLHFVKIRGVKPNILKTSGDQENKYVLNTVEKETYDHEKETEITSNKDDVAYEVKNSLKRNNELYNHKNNFRIRNLNNKNKIIDKIIMNARKQNSKAKTDKVVQKEKDNGKIILYTINPTRRYINIDPGLNSALDSWLLGNDRHVRHIYYDGSVERRMEGYNYDRHRPYFPYVPSNVDREGIWDSEDLALRNRNETSITKSKARQLEREKHREERRKRREREKYEKAQRKLKKEKEKKKRRKERQKRRAEREKRRAEREKRREERQKRREERKKRLEKEKRKRKIEQQKPQKKKTEKYQRQTTRGYSKKGKTFSIDDFINKNVKIEIQRSQPISVS